MMVNTRSFLNWQGNQLLWWPHSRWVVLGLVVFFFILIFIFKKQIKWFFTKNTRILIWKNIDSMLVFLGWFILLFQLFKLVLYIIFGYPLYWEHLMLHICRLHMLVIAVLLIVHKKELLKYIVSISILGALGAIYFGELNYPTEGNILFLYKKHNILFRSVGPDNLFYYDFFLFHLAIIFIPVLLWTGYSWKITTINFYRAMLVYAVGIILLWSFNAVSSFFPPEWRANNWYIGPDEQNNYHDTLGTLSGWPQNLFSYTLLGIMAFYLGHLFWIWQSFNRKKLYQEFAISHKNFCKKFKNQKT